MSSCTVRMSTPLRMRWGGEGVPELVGRDPLALRAGLADHDLEHAVDAAAMDGLALPGAHEQVPALGLGAMWEVSLDAPRQLNMRTHSDPC
jgi:hypothetical protein